MSLEQRETLWSLRSAIVDAPDTVCLQRARLITEGYRDHEGEPPAVQRASAVVRVMRGLTLDVDSNPFLAGNASCRPNAWMLLPEYGMGIDEQVRIENDGLDGLLDDALPADVADYWRDRAIGGLQAEGHIALDLRRLVHEGLGGIMAELDGHAGKGNPRRQAMRRAMRISMEGLVEWAGRYAVHARQRADVETAAWRRDALGRVARACEHVPLRPARSLFEALQSITLVHFAAILEGHCTSLSIGNLDRVLAPFAGEMDDESATVLLAAFLLKLHSNPMFGRGTKTQAVTIGGLRADGSDACNAVTRQVLAAADFIRLADPHVFCRWHERMDSTVRDHAVDMLSRGVSMPLLVHDRPTVAGLVRCGVAPEDAWEYAVIGCNEIGIPGRLSTSAVAVGQMNYLACVAEAMAAADPPADLADLLSRVEALMADQLERTAAWKLRRMKEVSASMPSPLTSAMMSGHAAAGCDVSLEQAYSCYGQYERGLSDAVNALAALEATCRPDSEWSLADVAHAMAENFAGRHDTLRNALRAGPKWGNDDARADRWARRLIDLRRRAMARVGDKLGTGEHLACHVVRSLHHVDGRRIPASPDGRRAGEPVCDSIGAVCGTALAGPTALLNSVLTLNAPEDYPGGTNLNLTLTPETARPAALRALIEAFFADGGQELQVNVLSVQALRDAQVRPEAYRDLVVRVSGLNALFVKLARREQEEIIRRAEAAGR